MQSILSLVVLILLFLASACAADGGSSMVNRSDEALNMNSGRLRLGFSLKDSKIVLTTVRGKNSNLLGDLSADSYFWRVSLVGTDSKPVDVKSCDVTGEVADVSESDDQAKCRFAWPVKLPDGGDARVFVDIRCHRNDNLSYWRFSADLPKGWKVAVVEFPCVPAIRSGGGMKLAAPVGWGLEYQNPGKSGYGGTYPSGVAAMQFMALYRPTGGIYVGAHDPSASHKHLQSTPDTTRKITCRVTNWTPLVESPHFELSYDAVIGVIDDGYMEAASIYSAWAKTTKWWTPEVSKRPIPEWLKETDLWLVAYGDSPDLTKALENCRKTMGVNTSVHWYVWHQIPFDTLYPEYLPPKKDWPDRVKEAQSMGYHVMPYINGRLWDPASESWKKDGADKSAAKKDNREFYTEVYGSKVPLNVMCPSTELWQNKITGLVDTLVNKYGVDGVYIDQICAAGAERCFDSSHSHPIGGGNFWSKGYRQMLEKVRAKLRPGTMITTEENAEPWNDQLDALLLVNTATRTDAVPIPLYPAVYSGHVIPFGFQYILGRDYDESVPFRMKMARCFLWGSQIGWLNAQTITDPKYSKEAEFLGNLARARSKAHKYLLSGRFMGNAKVDGDNSVVSIEAGGSFGGTYRIEMSSVTATKWRSSDGKTAVALCNISDSDRRVIIESQDITIPARGAVVVELGE